MAEVACIGASSVGEVCKLASFVEEVWACIGALGEVCTGASVGVVVSWVEVWACTGVSVGVA